MSRTLSMFRGLQWKLTLSYALVTAISIVILQLGLLAYSVYFSESLAPVLVAYMRDQDETAEAYMRVTPIDRGGLLAWLQRIAADDELGQFAGRLPVGEIAMMAVVDTEGRVLAAHPLETVEMGQLLLPHLTPAAANVLQTALKTPPGASFELEDRFEGLTDRSGGSMLVGAVPLEDGFGRVRGAWIIMTDQATSGNVRSLASFTGEILFQIVQLAVIFAVIVGTLFGFITARGLTRRLRHMISAAHAWGEGDFSAGVRDASGDELGQLGQQLNRMAEELQNLLQMRQELATVDERNRLARDLHDSVKQQLFATGMQIGAARALLERDSVQAEKRLADAERLAHDVQKELTMIIQELRPAALENKGLAAALRDYIKEWSQHSGIMAYISYRGERELPLALEQALFRVAQEALANVARHSGANRVDVYVVWTHTEITLQVADNGRGFHHDTRLRKGVGLQSMQERLQSLGGTLDVASIPGQGTTVTAQVGMFSSKRSKDHG